jgi:ABC-type multidrug transport system permease subunit
MEFIIAQIGSRMTLVLSITTLVYVGTHLILGTPMEGHYFDLFVVAVLGTITLVALGLMIAARVTSEELAGGLLNMINWPMMLLSGVWFSLEGAGTAVQQAAKIFPLTHILDAWRSIMFDGASLVDVGSHLITLVAMAVVFLLLGSRVFRWNQD